MLIRNAGMYDGTIADVCIDGASVTAIGTHLQARPGEALLDARGGALLPGLHDHHVHLMALANSLQSLRCGPPEVSTAAELERRLRERDALPVEDDDDWIRGIGYHESVAGDIDRAWLDRVVQSRSVRIQHRSGRLWIVNSRGLQRLAASMADSKATRVRSPEGLATGRVLDADLWLRERLGGRPPSLHRVSALLSSHGVTGVTDASASNTRREHRYFLEVTARGELVQQVIVMGDASLDAATDTGLVRCGPTKIYLRESALPESEELRAWIVRSHAARRPVAVHCVTDAELVFAVAAIAEVGSRPGDRIEHASVAPPEIVSLLADQGLTVVTQPNFVRERGDTYLAEVPARDRPWLYRGRGFLDAGIRLAAGTDAPLGDPNPWLAMQAAVDRQTTGGRTLGEAESLSPEEALALFSGEPLAPGGGLNRITTGSNADLCLLDRPWSDARRNLAAARVSATVQRGRLVWQRTR
ncbi:MAG: amidohydrolase family protein [Steroidobacteraceae bacterium]